ncbi:hypothetical protein GCM10027589_30280 [Actinocorallia lasiicapitis]
MPDEILSLTDIAKLCEAGGRAPSGGNAQPWHVVATRDALTIGLDDKAAGSSFLDVAGFGSLLALGCFAENVAITARSLGLAHETLVRKRSVEIRFSGRGLPRVDRALQRAIFERSTNRLPGDQRLVPPDSVGRLRALARDPFLLSAVERSPAKDEVAKVVAEADLLRLRDARSAADLTGEINWPDQERDGRRDGIEPRNLALPKPTAALLSLIRRAPRLGAAVPSGPVVKAALRLADATSHLCCLATTEPPDDQSMIETGMLVQRLWLTAVLDGLSVQPWTAATFLLLRHEHFDGVGLTGAQRAWAIGAAGRLRAAFALGDGVTPLFVFRLFSAPHTTPSSHRHGWKSRARLHL